MGNVAFVTGVGTGGTLQGSDDFEEKNPNIQVVLADPVGSGLATSSITVAWVTMGPIW